VIKFLKSLFGTSTPETKTPALSKSTPQRQSDEAPPFDFASGAYAITDTNMDNVRGWGLGSHLSFRLEPESQTIQFDLPMSRQMRMVYNRVATYDRRTEKLTWAWSDETLPQNELSCVQQLRDFGEKEGLSDLAISSLHCSYPEAMERIGQVIFQIKQHGLFDISDDPDMMEIISLQPAHGNNPFAGEDDPDYFGNKDIYEDIETAAYELVEAESSADILHRFSSLRFDHGALVITVDKEAQAVATVVERRAGEFSIVGTDANWGRGVIWTMLS